jgi:hypothetical protein
MTRIEALWRTLIADELTEVDDYPEGLDTRDGLAAGFTARIIADILEARSLLTQFADIGSAHWAGQLVYDSFSTRMSLWSAIYDEKRIPAGSRLPVPHLGDAIDDFAEKKEQEKDQYQLDQHLDVEHPTIGLEHFPTAKQIGECFGKQTYESDKKDIFSLAGSYRTDTLQRLTSRQRRELRNFEKHMRKATEGRRLLCSSHGLLGLGPMSTAQDKDCKDEIWLLGGARVPFILRQLEDGGYKIIGEAYVHGLMYGEAVEGVHVMDYEYCDPEEECF